MDLARQIAMELLDIQAVYLGFGGQIANLH